MNNLEKNIQEVSSIIDNHPLVKEYLSLKKQICSSEEISLLEKEIVIHQKEMTKNLNNDEIYFKEKEIYDSLKKKYDSNPLIINFNAVSEELYSFLNEIKEAIE